MLLSTATGEHPLAGVPDVLICHWFWRRHIALALGAARELAAIADWRQTSVNRRHLFNDVLHFDEKSVICGRKSFDALYVQRFLNILRK
jgi:hypothetical protein